MNGHPLDAVERKPRTCVWEITGACNLRCVHCESRCGEPGARELSMDRMLETAESLARLGCRNVDVTGGEPLVRAGWDRLCRRLADLGIKVTLVTNGILLGEDALGRAIAAGVSSVSISLDGPREVHDATRLRPRPGGASPWEETMAGIRLAVGRIDTSVITQVNRTNMGELPAMGRLLRDLGVDRWQLQLAIPTGRVLDLGTPYVIHPDDLPALAAFVTGWRAGGDRPHIDAGDTIGYYTPAEACLRERRNGQGVWLGCQAGIRIVTITEGGRVRGCSAMPADFDAGDLHEESLEEIWSDADRFAYSTRFDPGKLTGLCAECGMGKLCRAGCTSMAYWVTGTIYENPYCLLALERKRVCT